MLRSEDGVSGMSSADGTSSVGSLVCLVEGKAAGSSRLCSFGPKTTGGGGEGQLKWH